MCAEGSALSRDYPFDGACGILRYLGQPVDFPELLKGEEVYRLVFQPSFDPDLVITVRLVDGTSGTISAYVVRERSADAPVRLDFAADLTTAEVAQFQSGPVVADYWSTPRSAPKTDPRHATDDEAEWITVCADGAQTIVEGWTAGRYHVAQQHCEDVKGLQQISIAMMKSAEAKFRELPMNWAYEYY